MHNFEGNSSMKGGLVSPALLLLVGSLYDRHKTRLLRYYGGCGRVAHGRAALSATTQGVRDETVEPHCRSSTVHKAGYWPIG